MRAPGMTWMRMPLFCWSLYATSLIMVLATPVLAVVTMLLAVERIWGVGIFDPALGGDPVLFQHLFWFYSHPAVYIMILPGFGIISGLITCFSRKRIFGYGFISFASMAIAILGFVVWGNHMFLSSQSVYSGMVFSFLSFVIAVPSATRVFNWVATSYKGSISFETLMVYALGFIGLFTIGGMTGLFVAALATDVHLHDTYFVVAHFHYIMVGGMVLAFIGGLHYWWPKVTGRRYPEHLGQLAALVTFVGFNLTFFPQVHPGLSRNAAPLPCLPARVVSVERPVHSGRDEPGRRLPDVAGLPDLVAEKRAARERESLGGVGPEMADILAAAQA